MNNFISDNGGHLSLCSQKFFEEKNEQKKPNEHLYFNFEFYRTSLITIKVRFFNYHVSSKIWMGNHCCVVFGFNNDCWYKEHPYLAIFVFNISSWLYFLQSKINKPERNNLYWRLSSTACRLKTHVTLVSSNQSLRASKDGAYCTYIILGEGIDAFQHSFRRPL